MRRAGSCFFQDIPAVCADGMDTFKESGGDLFRAKSCGKQLNYPEFTVGKYISLHQNIFGRIPE